MRLTDYSVYLSVLTHCTCDKHNTLCLAPVGLRFQSDRFSAVEGASAEVCIVATNNGDQDVTVSGLIVGPGKTDDQANVYM